MSIVILKKKNQKFPSLGIGRWLYQLNHYEASNIITKTKQPANKFHIKLNFKKADSKLGIMNCYMKICTYKQRWREGTEM